MNKQMNINLSFSADATAAKKAIQDLQNQLNTIATSPVNVGQKLTPQLQEASRAAAQLQQHLAKATNVKTGALDFGKLNNSIKQSGMSLSEYGAKLQGIGPQGKQAFMSLANSVAMAEIPMRRASGALSGMMMTLKNTAKWQLSSSLLHGFIRSVSDAYGYAQDLNESLNNIRIVTGYNIDQMSKFANEANKAAKALSTSTTAYTNASLIYYQQGLSDEEVKKRTDVTIKMANVTRQNAEVVSDQLTSIWNNFYDGSKSLEYYADTITALGAATASSSQEISDGLEKFAAVAETVGLSYEYATSALATVTATTRQSADVVGTAFKTLFARLNDLKLGKTLEDGTTLGQYTENLARIGVNIKDTSGQLKSMDQILTETAAKWNTLGKDQQTALAKGVAGIRQYTQFVALMDNWDFMKNNLETVKNSEKTLQKQQEIYAESWEGAQKRVRAAAEKLYSALLDDKFFISLTNKFGDLIDGVAEFTKSMGGLQGVLSTFGLVITKIFNKQIAEGFRNILYNLKMSTKGGQQLVQEAKAAQMQEFATMMGKSEASTAAELQTKKVYEQELTLQQELIANAGRMTEEEQKTCQVLLEQHRILGKQSIELQRQIEALKDRATNSSLEVMGTGMLNNADFKTMAESMQKVKASAEGVALVKQQLADIGTKGLESSEKINALKQSLQEAGMTDAQIEGLSQEFHDLQAGGNEAHLAIEKIQATIAGVNQVRIKEILALAGVEEGTKQYERLEAELKNYSQCMGEVKIKSGQLENTNKNLALSFDGFKKELKKAGVNIQDWATNLSTALSSLMSAGMLISSITSLLDTFEDPDASGWEKFGRVLTSVSMIAMSFGGVIKGLRGIFDLTTKALQKDTWAKIENTLVTYLQAAARKKNAEAADQEEEEIEETSDAIKEETGDKIVNEAVDHIDFKGKNGKTRTFSGKYNKQGKMIDDNGQVIGQKYQKKYDLNNFGKPKGDTVTKAGKGASKGAGKAAGKAVGKGAGEVATKGAGKAAASGGSLLGSIAIAAVVAAAVIAVCAVGIDHLSKALNKNEIEAKKAEAAAEALAEQYSNVRQKYDSLISTISEAEEAKNSLKDLTKGTAEFSAAVTKANDASLELLNTYGDIIDNRYKVDANGLISIDEEALEDIKKQEMDKVQQAQSASIIAKQKARDARFEANATKAHREKIKTQEGFTSEDAKRANQNALGTAAVGAGAGLAVGAGMALSGAAAGAAAGSAVPVVGTIIGAVAGLLIGGIAGAVTQAVQKNSETEEEKQALKALSEEYMAKGESALTDEKIKAAYGKDLTREEIDAIKDLCKEMKANTVATEAENRAMAASILQDNERVQNSRDVEDIAVFAGEAYGEASKEALDKYMGDDYKANFWGNGSSDQEDAWERYAKAKGLTDLKDYKVTDYRKDGGVEYEYYNEETKKKEKKVITQEEWAAVLAAQDADTATNEAANTIADIVDKLKEETVDLLSAAKSGDMSGLTVGELTGKNNELETLTEEELHQLGFEGTKDEILQKIQEQQQANIENIKIAANQYGSSVSGLISTMLDTNDSTIKNVTQGTLKAYADTLNNLALHGGKDVMKNFDKGLQGIMDTYSEKSEKIMSIANKIDWSSGDSALQDFNYQLMQIGINIDEGSKEWQYLVNSMKNMNTSVVHRDLDAIKSQLTDIKKLCDKIEIGSIITDEEYDKLIKYKAELADLFIMTADGYRYIGGGDLSKDAEKAAAKQLEDTKDKNKNAKDANKAFSGVGWSDGTNFTSEDWYGLANGTDSNINYNKMTNFLTQGGYAQHVENLGYDPKYLQELSNKLAPDSTATEDEKKAAKEQLQKFYQDILTLKDNEKAGMYDDTTAEEVYASMATTIEQLNSMSANLTEGKDSEAYKKQLTFLINSNSAAAQSLQELQDVWNKGLETGQEVDYSAYANNLIRLAEQFTICTDEITEFNIALESGNKSAIESAQANLEASILLGEAAKKYGIEEEELSVQTKTLSKQYNLNARAAAKLAIENQRMNKGVSELVDNWEKWKKELKNTSKTSQDWAKVATKCTKVIADLVGASEDLELSSEFFESAKNIELLNKAAQGSEEAILELGLAVATAQIQMLEFQEGMKNSSDKLINKATFDNWKNNVLLGITNLQNSLNSIKINDDVYKQLGGDNWINALNEMARATHMSVDEMNSLLNSMGVDAEIITDYVDQETKVPIYETITSEPVPFGENGETKQTSYTNVVGYKPVIGKVPVAQINMGDAQGKKPKITFIGNGNVSSSSSAGSGNKTKTSDKQQKKSSIVTRYKEIDDQLDLNSREKEKTNKQAERLWGSAKLSLMKQSNNLLKEELELLKQKRIENERYLKEDKQLLQDSASEFNIKFTIDPETNLILDYEEKMNQVYNQRKALLNSFGSTIEEDEQKQLDEFDKKVSELQNAISTYEDTVKLNKDLNSQVQEQLYTIQDQKFAELELEIELKIIVNDAELKRLEYFLQKYESNFYKMAKSAELLMDQQDYYKKDLAIQEYKLQQLEARRNAANEEDRISDVEYYEALGEINGKIYDDLAALNESDKTLLSYLDTTAQAASDHIAEQIDNMEHITGIFDHYLTLMDLFGKSKDYKAMDEILQGKADTIANQLSVAQAEYDFYKDIENKAAEALELGRDKGLSEDQIQILEQQLEDAKDRTNEAQEKVLSKTEEWAEAMKKVIENALAESADTLEKSLTGIGFESLMDEYDKLNTRQEEFLTKTNQIYETNKMMRTANAAADKTENAVAKQKLKNFVQETKNLQNTTKLSQYELEIQQAKYDLLLAEIALEEAQNAKTTVRLTRDAEGNFGYIYTADSDKISDAQQKYEDSENALYNKSLEGQQTYTEKYLQATQSMYEELTALSTAYINGEIESEEEYNRQKEVILEHYLGEGGVLETYSSLYNIAVQADTNATADNWQTKYGDMTQNTEDWKKNVNKYIGEVKVQFGTWETVSKTVNKNVKDAFDKSAGSVDALLKKSIELRNYTVNTLIPDLGDEVKAVDAVTSSYQNEAKAINDVITAKENLALDNGEKMTKAAGTEPAGTEPAGTEPAGTEPAGTEPAGTEPAGTEKTTADDIVRDNKNLIQSWIDQNNPQTYEDFQSLYTSQGWGEVNKWSKQAITNVLGWSPNSINIKLRKQISDGLYANYLADLFASGKIYEFSSSTAIFDSFAQKHGFTDSSDPDYGIVAQYASLIMEDFINCITEGFNLYNDLWSEEWDGGEEPEILMSNPGVRGGEYTVKFNNLDETLRSKGFGKLAEYTKISLPEGGVNVWGEPWTQVTFLQKAWLDALKNMSGGGYREVKPPIGMSFDTGGYTGDWGPEGKLAMLHQKELILNANDTENILNTVSFVRDLMSSIDSNAAMSSLRDLFAYTSPSHFGSNIEQDIKIYAEFPSATNHSEIEEAFNNLLNTASQYANRKS